jgi:MFS family permease
MVKPGGQLQNVKKGHFYYGWVIIVVSFLTLFLALGVRYSYSVFFVALLSEYGWSRAEAAGAFSLAMVVHALFSPVTGVLIDRFGPRKLFPLGAVILALGLTAASRTTALWHLYLFFGVAVAIGVNTLSYSPHMSLVPIWFVQKRGFASGLVSSSLGIGTLVIVPLAERIIHMVGWRSTFLLFAGMILCIVFPMTALFQRRSPEEIGQFPDGLSSENGIDVSQKRRMPHKRTQTSIQDGPWTWKGALRTKTFWFLGIVAFSNGFLLNTLLVHQVIYMVDAGYSEMVAASLFGIVGLIGSVGGILCGHLSDRIGRELAYTVGSSAAFMGLFFLMFIKDTSTPWLLYAFVILYGAGYGAVTPLVASATGDLFPGNALGRILSVQALTFGIGGALGPYLVGDLYDRTGSYDMAFLLFFLVIALGVLGIWIAGPRRRMPIR